MNATMSTDPVINMLRFTAELSHADRQRVLNRLYQLHRDVSALQVQVNRRAPLQRLTDDQIVSACMYNFATGHELLIQVMPNGRPGPTNIARGLADRFLEIAAPVALAPAAQAEAA